MSETPIYDALVLERAVNDEEGRGLVASIHERQRQRALAEVRLEARVRASVRDSSGREWLRGFPLALVGLFR